MFGHRPTRSVLRKKTLFYRPSLNYCTVARCFVTQLRCAQFQWICVCTKHPSGIIDLLGEVDLYVNE